MENQQNNMCCANNKPVGLILAVLLAVVAIYVAVLAYNAVKSGQYIGKGIAVQNTITVSGNGDVSTKPDLAVMDFSVVSEGKTVAAATDDNTKKMNAVIAAAKNLGVTDKDLQTTGYNISPRYDYVKQAAIVPSAVPAVGSASVPDMAQSSPVYYPNGQRVLSGYDVTQTLTVKMRGEMMNKIGQIIEGVTAAGANQAGDLQFTLDNPDAVQAQARDKAITDAKAKADVLAKQLGVKLAKIVSFSEGGYAPVYQMNFAKTAAADSAGGGVAAPSIQTGESKTTVNVSITYEVE